MNASGFLYLLSFCLIIEGNKTFDNSFSHKWAFVPICKTYNFFDGSGCHPCVMEKCQLIRIKANTRCQLFSCNITVTTLPTSFVSTSVSTPPSTTTVSITTTTTSITTTTTTTISTTTTTTTATTEM